nr:trafficking protein particle complex II-specific subunit 120 homolog [Ipomoea batatas]
MNKFNLISKYNHVQVWDVDQKSYHLADRMGQRDPVLEDEVKYRYNSVVLHYRKSFIQDNAQRWHKCLLRKMKQLL